MKFKITLPGTGKLILSLFALSFFIFYGCKKELSSSTSDNEQADPLVADAKNWYENIYSQNSAGVSTNAVTRRKWTDGVNPDWNITSISKRSKETVIEMPLNNSTVSFAVNVVDGSKIDLRNNYAKTSYLITRDSSGKFNAYLMAVIADTAYINGNFSKLSGNTFKSRDKDFSGRLIYFSPDGNFLAGWRYEQGKITKTLSAGSATDLNTTRTQSLGTNTIQQSCSYYAVTLVRISA